MRHCLFLVPAVVVFSASLFAQATTWTSFQDRRGHAMASTPAGGVVMFGGERVTQPGTSLSDTHRLATGNQSWSRSANAPIGRSGHGMAGIMVGGLPKYFVFGGITSSGQPSADTWQYDGSSWDPRGQGGASPTARSAHAMVSGQLSGAFSGIPRVWMFGGFSGTAELSDLWSYQPDVDQWNLLGSSAGQAPGAWPASRSAHCLAFVPGLNAGDERVYLFGGRTGISGFSNDLWRYNPHNNSWQQLAPPSSPSARRDAAMAFVPGLGGIVLFGGRSGGSSGLSDTWVYDPSANVWTQRSFAVSPLGRYGHAVTVDASGDRLILMGGVDSAGQPAWGTWMFDSQAPGSPPGAWIEQLPVPSPRSGVGLAFDANPARSRHVLFGGATSPGGIVVDETWELQGLDWTRRQPSARPSARRDAGMVFHAGRGRVLLYGGRNQSGLALGDTWEWNGTTWTIPAFSGTPRAAGGVQPVYDAERNRLVMPVAGPLSMETWVLSGSSWSALPLTVQPSPRTNYGAAYDNRRDRVVMFGGMSTNDRSSAVYNNETWVFDGQSWVRMFPETSPSPRGWCQLAYDESRSRIVLFGGVDAVNVFEETWEWDGSNWILETPSSSPSNPGLDYGNATTYDPRRALTVTSGAFGTWDYGPVATADVESYGTGCQTSAGATLNLKRLGWSRLWLGDRLELDIEGAPALSLGLMMWGLSNTTFGAGVPLPLDLRLIGFSTGPCFLSTSADITTEALFPPATRYVSFPMPVDPFLLGLQLYLQMAYFDAPANPSNPPAVTSNALKMKLGQKASIVTRSFEPNPALNMVRVGAGTFLRGSPVTPLNVAPYFNQATSQPVHAVTITAPFWVGKCEVTQGIYQSLVGSNPSFHQGATRPVDSVTWFDAMNFCSQLNATEAAAGRVPAGYEYRLPTEAEWEYCCRAGTTTEYAFGQVLLCGQANFGFSHHSNTSCAIGGTTPVGSYPANGFGLYDMHGNVAEWCRDFWDTTANYPSAAVVDPFSSSGSHRVLRGAGFNDSSYCRSASRDGALPSYSNLDIGFRVVLGPVMSTPLPIPVASFTVTPSAGIAPLSVQFTDTSTNGPTSWQWDFQDDGVVDSTVQNPTHVYSTPGVYPVRLTVANPLGSSSFLLAPGIHSQALAPVASFTATPTSGVAPLQVQFTDTSANSPTSWQWDFENDGTVDSTLRNPSWSFAQAGTYSVRLVVSNQWGSNSVTLPGCVNASLPPSPSLNMVSISPGTFQMGSPEPLNVPPYFNGDNSTPVHSVALTRPFWIGAYEVTQAQYTALMPSNPSVFTQDPQQPVDSASWNDAMAFCAALTVAESAAGRVPVGYQYRLPTEAEWEYCCRAGSTSEFHFGSVLLCGMAWFEFSHHSNSTCSSSSPNVGPTATVGSYVPNAWGLYDMHGNVWEWCLDAWDATNNYPNQAVADPFVATGSNRILRGGGFVSRSSDCRSAFRMGLQDYNYNSDIGFRVVLAPIVMPGPLPPSVPLNMVPISPGTFQMGSSETPSASPYFNAAWSTPVHAVTITRPFWIGAWEVTQQHYMALMSINPSSANGGDPRRPVESVSWNDAMAYCAALTVYESATGRVPAGYHYRLPTEAEWEYCCRAGSTSEFHYGSDLLCGMAWFDYSAHTNSSCSSSSPNAGAPVIVGSYVPNAWGLHDMHGNVWEWCLDAWDTVQGYPNQAVADPFVATGPYRVCRGGAFASNSWDCRSAQRAAMPESGYNVSHGFRVVLAPMILP